MSSFECMVHAMRHALVDTTILKGQDTFDEFHDALEKNNGPSSAPVAAPL